MKNNLSNHRWIIAGTFWFLLLSYGASWFAVAPLLRDLEEAYKIGGAESHLLLSMIGLFVVFFAWPAGGVVDKRGPRASVLIGSIFMITGFTARIWLSSSYIGMLSSTAIAGMGLGWILVALAPQMIQWFEGNKASLAIGLVSSGLFIGFGVASLLSPYIKETYGMTMVYELFAVINLLSFILYIAFGKDKGRVNRGSIKIADGMKRLLSSPNAILYSLIGFFIVGSTLSASAFLPKFLSDFGLSELEGGNVISLMLFGSAFGAFSFPYIASRYGVKKTSLIIAIFATVLWMLFHLELSFFVYILIAFLFGLSIQASWPVALHCQETEKGVDEKNVGIAASLYISVSNIGGAILPVILGNVSDSSHQSAFLLLLSYLVIFTLLWALVKRR